VAFASTSTDLIAGDLNESTDVFAVTLDPTAASEDQDGDGLNDVWERANFSTLAYGAADDPDADGASNADEIRAGTNPSNVSSVFKIANFSMNASAANQLVFTSTPGKTYRVEFKATLVDGPWTPVGTDISASAGGETIVNLPASEGFYRLRLIE
jgi:hypothetical protein